MLKRIIVVHWMFLLGVLGCDPGVEVDPGQGPRGAQSMVLQLNGEGTHFDNTTTASFDSTAIQIEDFQVSTQESASLTISISDNAATGLHTLTLNTPGANFWGNDEIVDTDFEVLAQPSIIINPVFGERGESGLIIEIQGSNTHFEQPLFNVNLDIPGTTINSITVMDATTAQVVVDIDNTAVSQLYPDSFEVETDYQFLTTDFEIIEPRHIEITPHQGMQGQLVTIIVQGYQTNFTSSATAWFSSTDLEIININVLNPDVMELDVVIHDYATPQIYDLTIDDGLIPLLSAPFEVIENPNPAQVVLNPAFGEQFSTTQVTASGTNTHFISGQTTLEISPVSSEVSASITSVDELNQTIELEFDLAFDAAPGFYDVTFNTYGEHVTAQFEVVEIYPAITQISPSFGHQNETVTIIVTGVDTHWNLVDTTINIPGTNPIIVAASPQELTIELEIASDAALGDQIATITTGPEAVTGIFTILQGLPGIELDPLSVSSGQITTVDVNGVYTDFTGLGFGVSVDGTCLASVVSTYIVDESQMSFQIEVPLEHPPGTCDLVFDNVNAAGDSIAAQLIIEPGFSTIDFGFEQTGVELSDPVYYAVQLDAGAIFKARSICEIGSTLDTVITVAGADADFNSPLAQNDDESVATWDSLLVFQAPQTGLYYLKISDRLNINSGYFTMKFHRYLDTSYLGDFIIKENYFNDSLANAQLAGTDLYWGRFVSTDATDCYQIDTSFSMVDTVINPVARRVSPYEVSGAQLKLYLYDSSQTLIAEHELASEDADPVVLDPAAAYVCLENRGASDTFYLLNLTPSVMINEFSHHEDSGSSGDFVELYGDPQFDFTGCSLQGYGINSDATNLFDIALEDAGEAPLTMTSEGYLVIAHDTLVPGTGGDYLKPALEFAPGYATYAIVLQCGAQVIDEVCWGVSHPSWCDGQSLDSPSSETLGRGFNVKTGTLEWDFIPQIEPSPWERNLTEVSQ